MTTLLLPAFNAEQLSRQVGQRLFWMNVGRIDQKKQHANMAVHTRYQIKKKMNRFYLLPIRHKFCHKFHNITRQSGASAEEITTCILPSISMYQIFAMLYKNDASIPGLQRDEKPRAT